MQNEFIAGQNIDLVLKKSKRNHPDIPRGMEVCSREFDIVLHGTTTRVGEITARLGFNDFIYYGGHVGFGIDEAYRGRGFAVEAVKLLEPVFSVNGIDKIYITNNPDNAACIRVCEKLGARFIECAALPANNNMRIKRGETHKNIFELDYRKL